MPVLSQLASFLVRLLDVLVSCVCSMVTGSSPLGLELLGGSTTNRRTNVILSLNLPSESSRKITTNKAEPIYDLGLWMLFLAEPLIRLWFQCVHCACIIIIDTRLRRRSRWFQCILLLQLLQALRAKLAASSNSRFSHAIDKYSVVRNIVH